MTLDLSLIGQKGPATSFSYTWKDTALYALGVGAKKDELDYLYEGFGPKVLPSFAVVPMFDPMFERVAKTGGDLAMVVHGGQKFRVHSPFPSSATLHTSATIRAIYDLRRFAQVIIDTETKDDKGALIAETTASIIFRGEGGFGGDPPVREEKAPAIPKDRPANFRVEEATSAESALLYRLSGDLNPLHADPEFAKRVGFEQGPILHGLCTYGYLVRHVAKGAAKGDAQRIVACDGQFKKPVWPGDTLVTEGWEIAPGKIAVQLSVKERNEVVLGSAWAEYK